MYSNEGERADKDIYYDFKLKKTFVLYGFPSFEYLCYGSTAIINF